MIRGAWQAIIHGITKSWTQLSTHACTLRVKSYQLQILSNMISTVTKMKYLPQAYFILCYAKAACPYPLLCVYVTCSF